MNARTMVAAATLLMATCAAALCQTSEGGQTNPGGQSVRDILNRAQTQSDRKAVEDLIGRLRGSPATPPPGAGTVVAPQAPVTPAAPAPGGEPRSIAPPLAPPVARVEQPAPVSLPPDRPLATAPAAAPPTAATLPTADAAPLPAATGGPQLGLGGTTTNSGAGPAAPVGTAPPAEIVVVPAPAAPLPREAVSIPAPAPAPAAAPETAVGSAPLAATPASAPAGSISIPSSATPPAAGPDTSATAPVGAPIGPAAAFPTPIGPTDAEMARAPDIAREKGLPAVDIEVLFAYDSSEIVPEAAQSLASLGRALADPRLAGQKFVIAGHTDAKGATGYNLNLSERRAQAVRAFLVEQFKIEPDNLLARGFGESRLKNPRNPLGPENRRVQVINWSATTAERRRR